MTPRDRNRLAAAVAMLRNGYNDYAVWQLEAGGDHCIAVLATLKAGGPIAAIRDAEERLQMEGAQP